MILAGIDIGTNTIRLLVADISGSACRQLYSGRTITRLGQDLVRTGVLAPEAQERSLTALESFSRVIRRFSADQVAVVGTSALRNASNAREFITAVRQRAGLDVRIIPGAEEARLTLRGVHGALSKGKPGEADPLASALVIDIGGGSTEIIRTVQGNIETMTSLPLGAVYLTERYLISDPPLGHEVDGLRTAVRGELDVWEREAFGGSIVDRTAAITVAGTAGTITTLAAMDQALAAYDPAKINGYTLARSVLDRMVNMLSVSTLDARRRIAGLEPGREDIILAGAVVAQEIMERCGARQLLVSDWGLREGIVLDLYDKNRA